MHPIKVKFKSHALPANSLPKAKVQDIEVAVTIHSSNVWIELPDGFGFSMTADQAEIILNGITEAKKQSQELLNEQL